MKIKKIISVLIISIIIITNLMPIVYGIDINRLSSKAYKIDLDKKIIYRIAPNTTYQEFIKNLSIASNDTIQVYKDENKSQKITSGLICTSMVLEYTSQQNSENYKLSVIGDIDENGKLEQIDLTKTIRHIVGQKDAELTGIHYLSSDITGDGLIDQRDITKYIKYIVYGELDIDLPSDELQEEIPKDTTAPELNILVKNVTSNTVNIEVSAKDNEAMPSKVLYKYYIKENSDYKVLEETTEANYTINNLKQNTKYFIKVETKDSAGNIGTCEKEILTGKVKKLTNENTTFNYNSKGWTNGDVVVTVDTKKDGYILQTSKNGIDWENSDSQTFSENGIIYARLRDSSNQVSEALTASIDNIDKLSPNGQIEITNKSNSIKVTVTAKDQDTSNLYGKSEIKGYYYSKDNGITYTDIQESNIYEFTNLTQATDFEIRVKIEDNAGNIREIGKETKTVEIPNDTITINDVVWNANTNKASAKIYTTQTDYKLQYSDDRQEWIDIVSSNKTKEYPLGTTIYARLWDDVNESSKYASIKITDNNAPSEPKIEVIEGTMGDNNWYTTPVTVKITDGSEYQSGVKETVYILSGAMTKEETVIENEGTIKITKNGETVITAYTFDKAGNKSNSSTLKIYQESNLPIIEDVIVTSSKIKIIATGSKAKINGYAITRNNSIPTEFVSCDATLELNVEIDNYLQSKDYYIWVKDEAGNISDYKKVTMQTVPINTITINNIAWNKESHKASATISTVAEGYSLQYSVDKENWIDITSGNKTREYPVNTIIYARLFDGINESLDRYESLKLVDKTAPSSPIIEVADGTMGLSNWYTSDVKIKITSGIDNQCGVNRTTYVLEGAQPKEETEIRSGDTIIIKTDGITTITAYTYDNVENRSEEKLTIYRDATLPVVLDETSSTTNSITIRAIDEMSGIIGYTITENTEEPMNFTTCNKTDDLTVTIGEKIQTKDYYVWVKDEAGNISNYKKIKTKTIPTGTITINDIAWNPNTHKATVTVSTTETDYILQYSIDKTNWKEIVSGTKTDEYPLNTIIYARLWDGTNEASEDYPSIQISDIELPSMPIFQVVGGTAGSNEWYTSNVDVQIIIGEDYQSDVHRITYTLEGAMTKGETLITNGGIITISTDGITKITAYVYDNAGNVSEGRTIVIKKDEAKPVVLTETTATTHSIKIRATDAMSGIIGYSITDSINIPTIFTDCVKTKNLTAVVDELLQNKDYYVWVKDEAGLISNYRKIKTNPVPTGTITIDNIIWNKQTHKAAVRITTTVSEEEYTLQYSTDKTNWKKVASGTKTDEYPLGTTIYARLWDGTNESTDTYANLKITDGEAPNLPTLEVTSGTIGENEWYKSNVTVKITEGADDQCGVNRTTYTLTGATTKAETVVTSGNTITISNEGITTITAYTYDNAGNKSQAGILTIKKDTVGPNAPIIEVTEGTMGLNDWYTTNVVLKITAGSDATSDVQKVTYTLSGATNKTETLVQSGDKIAIINDGITTITAYTYDNTGHKSSGTTLVIKKDVTKPNKPTIEVTEGTMGLNNWYKSDITIKVTSGADATSNIWKVTYVLEEAQPKAETAITSGSTIKITTDGETKITAYTYDNAGNKSDGTTLTVKRDATKPNSPAVEVVSGTLGINGWYISDVKVKIAQGADATSNVQKVTYVLTGATTKAETTIENGGIITISNEGTTNITAYTYDNAGNKSQGTTLAVKKDVTKPNKPIIEITSGTLGQNNWYKSNITIKVTSGTDVTSNIQKVTYILTGAETKTETTITSGGTFDISVDGETKITAYTYDNAGNKSDERELVVYKDANLPVVGSGTVATSNNIKIVGTDAMSGIVGYTVTENTTVPTTFTNCTNTKQLEVNVGNRNQNKDYYVWLKDSAGNVSNYKKVTTVKIPTGTITINNIAWNASTHKATVTVSTTASGYTLQYSTDQVNWKNITSGTKTDEYALNTTIYARLYDGVNEANETHPSLKITDSEKPTSAKIEVSSGTIGNNNFYKSNITIKVISGEDYQSNVNRTTYVLTGANTKTETTITSGGTFNIEADGETKVTAYTYDNAGNKSDARELLVRKDATKPVVNDETVATTNKISISARDATSGIVGYAVTTSTSTPSSFTECGNTKQLTVDVTGLAHNKDYYVWVKDATGNVSDYKKRTTAPMPNGKITVDSIVWNQNTHKASVIFTTTETNYTMQYSTNQTNWTNITSGNKTKEYDLNTTVYARLWDGTNSSGTASAKITDTESPNTPILEVTSGITGKNNWYWSNVIVKVTGGIDNQSGVNRTTYTLAGATTKSETNITSGSTITISNDGTTTITAYTYDNAGNKSQASTLSISKDTVNPNAPTLTFVSGTEKENSWYSSNVVYKVTAGSEASSGLDKVTYQLQGSDGATDLIETTISSGSNITISSEGITKIIAKEYDNSGHESGKTEVTIRKDSTLPTLNVTDIETNSLRIVATDLASGINGYKVTETNTQPTTFTSVTATKSLNQVVSSLAKSKTYYVWVRDVAGNVASKQITTEAVPAANIVKDSWDNSTGQRAKISANNTGYTIQYSTNNSTWTTLTGNEAYTPYFAAGTTIYARLSDGSNSSGTVNSVTITKEEGKVTLNSINGKLTYPNTGTFTVSSNLSGGTLSCSTSNSNVATASISGTTVTLTPGTTMETTATITVTSDATYRYNSASATYSVVVEPGTITATINGYNGTYDGNTHGISISNVNITGYTVYYYTSSGTWTNSDTNFKYKNAGTYMVTCQISKTGYTSLTASRTVIINPKERTVSWSNTSLTYNGSEQGPSASASSGISGETLNLKVVGKSKTAGTYQAVASIESVTGGSANVANYKLTNETTNYTISKKNISPSVSMRNYTYAQDVVQSPSVSGNSGNGSVNYYYKKTSASSWTAWPSSFSSTSLDAGTYNIRAVISATDNYNGADVTGTNAFTVYKADTNEIPTINSRALKYDGTDTEYCISSSGNGRTIEYRYKTSENGSWTSWATSTPGRKGKTAGITYIQARYKETTNYKASSKNAEGTIQIGYFGAKRDNGDLVYFYRLKDAISYIGNGSGTIELYTTTLEDEGESGLGMSSGQDITLDLKNNILYVSGNWIWNQGGKLTVKDGSIVNMFSGTAGEQNTIMNLNGELTMSNVTVSGGRCHALVIGGGSINLNNVTLSVSHSNCWTMYLSGLTLSGNDYPTAFGNCTITKCNFNKIYSGYKICDSLKVNHIYNNCKVNGVALDESNKETFITTLREGSLDYIYF